MPRWKIKRNALVRSLFSGFCFLNMAVVSLLEDGMASNPVLFGSIVLALVSSLLIATDPQARHNTDVEVWCTLALHLIWTAFILTEIFFHWSIVVLYFLELALCIYIWRIKITR